MIPWTRDLMEITYLCLPWARAFDNFSWTVIPDRFTSDCACLVHLHPLAGRARNRCGPEATRARHKITVPHDQAINPKVSIVGRGGEIPRSFWFTCFRSSACCRTPARFDPDRISGVIVAIKINQI